MSQNIVFSYIQLNQLCFVRDTDFVKPNVINTQDFFFFVIL